jgi:hypothetical protein
MKIIQIIEIAKGNFASIAIDHSDFRLGLNYLEELKISKRIFLWYRV